MDEDSDFLPNQSGKMVDDGGDDRISELPNDILFEILSFLPLKQAAATSVLSSRWSDLWKHTPNLEFDRDIVPAGVDVHKYIEIVNSILQSHKAFSLKQFIISAVFGENKSAKGAVTKLLEKCLEFVFLRKVECLELDGWVDRVVLGESLREIHGNPRTLIFFESLKSLELVCLEVSGKDMELFLRNCPLLEVLEFHGVSLISDIEVCGPSLKRLVIFECSGGKSMKVSAPNLTVIRFDDYEVGKLLFENVPRLVEAEFNLITSEFIMHHFASAASSHMSQLQFLDILLTHPKAFWTNAFPQMPNLKKLAIACFEVYNHSLLPVTRLIWASPCLEEFTLEFKGHHRRPEDPTAYMQEISNVGRSPHQHLKVFHLHLSYKQRFNDHAVELLSYISNNCIALRRIYIVCRRVPNHLTHHLQTQLPNHVQLSIRRPQ